MYEMGVTRSARHHDHLLQTPDSFVRAPLPGMTKAMAVVHTAPPLGATFMEYTAEFEPGGSLAPVSVQRFVYVLEGSLKSPGRTTLRAGDYGFFPAGDDKSLAASRSTRAVVIEKPYEALPGVPAPQFFAGRESDIAPEPLNNDPRLEVRAMVPPDASFDFAVNTMAYLPGASLPMVEVHVMEHGLLMLEGGGIYRLSEHWYPVAAGDFIWMAPYCPQWFGAIGKVPAKYLIYKNWNRNPGGA